MNIKSSESFSSSNRNDKSQDDSGFENLEKNTTLYFLNYLKSIIQVPCNFNYLKQQLFSSGKPVNLDTMKPVQIVYNDKEHCIQLKCDNNVTVINLDKINKIEWGETNFESFISKYIIITFKNDKNPLIIHGNQENMDLWFDSLQLIIDNSFEVPSNSTSKAKFELFKKAVEISSEKFNTEITIPDPPDNISLGSSPNENKEISLGSLPNENNNISVSSLPNENNNISVSLSSIESSDISLYSSSIDSSDVSLSSSSNENNETINE